MPTLTDVLNLATYDDLGFLGISECLSQFVEWVSPEPSEKEEEGRLSRHCGCVMMIFLITAERDETRILAMIIRRKAFTVLGLMFIRFAISLVLMPCNRYSNTSRSRCVRLNCRETWDNEANPEGPLSSRIAMLG